MLFGKEKAKTREDLERSVLEQVALQSLKEQRKRRRWGVFFRAAFLIYLIVLMVHLWGGNDSKSSSDEYKPHVGIVDLKGVIAADSDARSRYVNEGLTRAFENKDTQAVILKINSPGGSPVQSDEIFQHMRALEKKYPNKPLYAVCEDVCASGGYYVASAAKDVYANKMSIVGSIGVIAGGFGFVDAMKKIGVERRLYTAGKNKGFLDPFSPQVPEQEQDFKKMLEQTHSVFIQSVEEGRGERLDLKAKETIFSGLPFSGIEAKKYGLIDGFMSVGQVAKDKVGVDTFVNYTRKRSFFERVVDDLGGQIAYQLQASSYLKLQ